MSKQYLTMHTVDNAHVTDIFSLAPTPTALLSASGSSTLHVHSTKPPSFGILQSISNAHRLGCHHVVTAKGGPGTVAASAGFGGEVKVWRRTEAGDWVLHLELRPSDPDVEGSDAWALALSADEQYLACTTHNGRVCIWDVVARRRVHVYDTGMSNGGGGGGSIGGGRAGSGAGSFAMAVDLSRDGRLTASGHQNGSVYVFNNDTGRMIYALSGLSKPIRAVAFSPLGTRLAAAGDAGVIAIYDMEHGEHVGNLTAGSPGAGTSPAWITSLDFSDTGEYLLSGSVDGKVRVWSIDRAACVATHSETSSTLWSVRWLPMTGRAGESLKGETFCTAGANRSITFYREATGA